MCCKPVLHCLLHTASQMLIKVHAAVDEAVYVLIDLPGQVELFTLHDSLKHIVDTITNKWSYR